MIRWIIYALVLWSTSAFAQQATTAPTRPIGDNSNAIATTAWVGQNSILTSSLGTGVLGALQLPLYANTPASGALLTGFLLPWSVANGGTGGTTAPTARSGIGLANIYTPADLPNVTAISAAVNVSGQESIFWGGNFNLNGILYITQPNVTIRCMNGAKITKAASPSGIGVVANNFSLIGCNVQGAGYGGDNINIAPGVTDTYLEDVVTQYSGSLSGSGVANAGTRTRAHHINASYNGLGGFVNNEAQDVDIDDIVALNNAAEGVTCDNYGAPPASSTCTIRRAFLSGNCTIGGVGNFGSDGNYAVTIENMTAINPGTGCAAYNVNFKNNVGSTITPRVYNSTFWGATSADILLNTQATQIPSGTPTIGAAGTGYAVNDQFAVPSLLFAQINNSNIYKVTSIGGGGSVTGIANVSTYPLGSQLTALITNPTATINTSGTGCGGVGCGSGLTLNMTWTNTGSYYNTQLADIKGVWSGSANGSVVVPSGSSGWNRISLTAWQAIPSLNDGTSYFDGGGNSTKGTLIFSGTSAAVFSALSCGALVEFNGVSSSVTMPTNTATPAGCTFILYNNTGSTITPINGGGAQFFGPGLTLTSTISLATTTQKTLKFDGYNWLTTAP